MKPDKCWTLQTIAGIPYILPFGQAIADLKRGILVNGTGAFLWEQLQNDPTREELLSAFAAHYQAAEQELPQFKRDLDEFLAQLTALGILSAEACAAPPVSPADRPAENHEITGALPSPQEHFSEIGGLSVRFAEIGGLSVRLVGPASAFAPEFEPFSSPPRSKTDLTVEIVTAFPRDSFADAPFLIRHPELTVQDCRDRYLLHFPQAPQIREVHLTKDGAAARFFCAPPFEEPLVTDLFHAIRLAYLYLAQKRGIFALHSASILYQGKAWLFSGHSGAGKSTHTKIWNRLFETPVLNGDLNLLTIRNKQPMVCGLPWCGTSGISTTEDYPLGGIILLKQAMHNLCLTPEPDRQVLLLSQRFISPVWTREQLEINLQFAHALTSLAPIRHLSCTKEDEAALYMKKQIDAGF
ncbi:MAG: PqqD family protein [Lachnospiraceae bacterium]|nr:PqqD family protein [Lachnospiraceae bacterium]